MEAKYNSDLTLSSDDKLFKIINISEWYDFEIDAAKKLQVKDCFIYEDDAFLTMPRLYKSRKKLGFGKLRIYNDCFEFITKNEEVIYKFEFENVEAVTYLGKKKMNIYYNGDTYQVFNKKDSCFLKYVHMYYINKNKIENKEDDFIGI
jgi:hypothetical protein